MIVVIDADTGEELARGVDAIDLTLATPRSYRLRVEYRPEERQPRKDEA